MLYDAPSATREAAVRLRPRRAARGARQRRGLDQGPRHAAARSAGLPTRALADKRMLRRARPASPTCARSADDAAPVVFRAEQNVLLELAEPATSPAPRRRPAGSRCATATAQIGLRAHRAGLRALDAARRDAIRPATMRSLACSAPARGARRSPSTSRRAHARPRVAVDARRGARARARVALARNARYLPGIALPGRADGRRRTSPRRRDAELADRRDADRRRCIGARGRLAAAGARAPLVWLSKGFVAAPDAADGRRRSRIRCSRRAGPRRSASSRGRASPRKSRAGCRRRSSVAATDPALAARARGAAARRRRCAPTTADDLAGVEVGGAVKNVLAIAAGASDGLGFGHNARAALITRGLAETARLAAALGGQPRDADGPGRTRRSRADLHRRPVAQPARRTRAGARRARCRRSSRSSGTSPKASRRRAPRARSRASRHRHADLRSGVSRAVRRPAAAARRRSAAARASRESEAAMSARSHGQRPMQSPSRADRSDARRTDRGLLTSRERAGRRAARSFRRRRRARPVVETLHGVTLTDRYRWLENGKDPDGRGVDARAARGDGRVSRPQRAAGARHDGRAHALLRSRQDRRAVLQERPRVLPARRGRASRRRSSTRGSTASDVLLFDPIALDPSGKTKIGTVVPNRDAIAARRRHLRAGHPRSRISASSTSRPARRSARRSPASTGSAGRATSAMRSCRRARRSRTRSRSRMRCYRHRLGGDRKRRRAADHDEGREELLPGLRARGGRRARCSRPATSGRTRSASGRSARPRSRGRSTPATSSRRMRSFRKRPHVLPHQRRRAELEADGGELRASRSSRDWPTLIPEQATVLDDVDGHARLDRRARPRGRAVAAHGLRQRRASACASSRCRCSATCSARPTTVDTDTVYATLASHTAPYKVYALDGRRSAGSSCGRTTRRSTCRRSSRARLRAGARTARRFPCSSCTARISTQDGANPTLLYGYGGFNIGVEPFYLGSYASFVNRGGVFVDAGVRGGNEYGETWHEQAMFAQKQNTFDDMIAVAEWLIAQKYTQPSKLAVEGGSNGGLTVGACSRSAPTCSARRSARCRCSTWCASTSS